MAIQAIIRRSLSKAAKLIGSQTINRTTFPSRFAVPTVRHFSSSNAVSPFSEDKNLLEVLQSEIQNAQLSYDDNNNGKTVDPPAHFTFSIEDNPGEQTVRLEKEYDGENITVEVSMPSLVTGAVELDIDGDDDVEEPRTASNIPLLVTVTRKDLNAPSLEFDCSGFYDEIRINSLSLKDPSCKDASEETLAYEGPDFCDLDEKLQKAFHKYLEIRDVRPSILGFLHEYMIEKDNREYARWLKGVKSFVEA